jgi:hypothetical protein
MGSHDVCCNQSCLLVCYLAMCLLMTLLQCFGKITDIVWNWWVSGLCPPSGILNEHKDSWTGCVSVLKCQDAITSTQFGPLGKKKKKNFQSLNNLCGSVGRLNCCRPSPAKSLLASSLVEIHDEGFCSLRDMNVFRSEASSSTRGGVHLSALALCLLYLRQLGP